MTDKFCSDMLLASAQAGDVQSLDELLRMHRDTVFRYGLRYCKSTENTEDAVQEALWAAARSIGGFRHASAITTWLFTIVRNKCHRLFRYHHAEPDLADILVSDDLPTSVEDSVAAQQLYRVLANALSRLEPQHREVILLRDIEGLTAPEAANRLAISVQALKSRLHRARAALRAEVSNLTKAKEGPNVVHSFQPLT
jgi:RNA polymerase sigma-70 factor, ECF subfamily